MVKEMSRIVITGGAGFIGSNLAQALVKRGEDVILLDLFKDPVNIEPFNDKVDYVRQDVRDIEKTKALFKDDGISGIVHLAAVSRVIWGEQNPKLCVDTNVGGTHSVLEAVERAGSKPWVIFGSSREVYGESSKFPVKENFPILPVNVYGRTKVEGERLIQEFSHRTNTPSAILRFSNVYGNEKDILDRVIPRFVIAGLKNECIEIHGGNQIIDFTHIDDTVCGIMKTIDVLKKQHTNGNGVNCQDYHLLPGRPVTLQDVASTISNHLDSSIKIRYETPRNYDVTKFHGDPTKAREHLGFTAGILPQDGIPMTIDRFQETLDL